MISWRTYWCLGAAIIVGALAALLVFFTVPLIPALLGLAAATLIAAGMARKVVMYAELFSKLPVKARDQVAGWITAGIITHAVWVLLVLLRPDLWLVWAGFLAVLCAASNGVAIALGYALTRIQPRAEAQRKILQEAEQQTIDAANAAVTVVMPPGMEPGQADPIAVARQAFALRGYAWLEINSWSSIVSGDEAIGIAYTVQIPASTGGKNNPARTSLSGEDVEPLAIAFSKVLGVPLESGWVHVAKQRAAGVYTVSVTTVDALAKVYPYIDPERWVSIKDPAPIGHTIDGTVVTEVLARHWADTGATRSGKTSLIHTKRARITQAHDAVLWVGGTQKLFDSVGPWIDPYLGTDEPLPFDAVANGPVDTAEMLACANGVARWRQTVPHRQRTGFMDIIVEIDEASFFLVMNKIFAISNGQALNPTQLACDMVKGMGSAGVWLHLAAQRGTNNNWGDLGGDISANIHTQTVFSTNDEGEVGRATGDYKMPAPTHPGEFLYTTGKGQPVQRLKAEYIQETDPTKPKLHDGATLSDVAWSRRRYVRHLDEGSARVARQVSAWYANRPTRADDVYEYLTGVVAEVSATVSPAYSDAYDEATEKVRAMLVEAGIPLIDDDATPAAAVPAPAVPTVPVMADNVMTMHPRSKTLKTWIEEVVARAETPLRRADIIAGLAEAGYKDGEPVNPQQVTNALNDLVQAGQLVRDIPNQTYESARVSA